MYLLRLYRDGGPHGRLERGARSAGRPLEAHERAGRVGGVHQNPRPPCDLLWQQVHSNGRQQISKPRPPIALKSGACMHWSARRSLMVGLSVRHVWRHDYMVHNQARGVHTPAALPCWPSGPGRTRTRRSPPPASPSPPASTPGVLLDKQQHGLNRQPAFLKAGALGTIWPQEKLNGQWSTGDWFGSVRFSCADGPLSTMRIPFLIGDKATPAARAGATWPTSTALRNWCTTGTSRPSWNTWCSCGAIAAPRLPPAIKHPDLETRPRSVLKLKPTEQFAEQDLRFN